MNPRGARNQFRLPTLKNCVLVGGIFVAGALIFAQLPFSFLLDLILGCVLYYFYFNIWSFEPIRFSCPHCGWVVATNTPWICGVCEQKNQNADDFPFVHRCEHCGNEPKAYRCHHKDCGNIIFLTDDEQE